MRACVYACNNLSLVNKPSQCSDSVCLCLYVCVRVCVCVVQLGQSLAKGNNEPVSVCVCLRRLFARVR